VTTDHGTVDRVRLAAAPADGRGQSTVRRSGRAHL